jgi:ATP-dependent Lon protease
VQGESRIRVVKAVQETPYLKAEVEVLAPQPLSKDDDYQQAALRNLKEAAARLLNLKPDVPDEVKGALEQIDDAGFLTDFLASNLSIETQEKQRLLEEVNVMRRVEEVQKLLDNQLRIAELQGKLRENVQSEFSEAQKRAYLREQLRAIQKELGEEGSTAEQVEDLRERLDKAALPEIARKQADRELKRLEIIPPASPDHSVIVSYLETLAELPWNILPNKD